MIKKIKVVFAAHLFEDRTEMKKKTKKLGDWELNSNFVQSNRPLCKKRIEMLKWRQGGEEKVKLKFMNSNFHDISFFQICTNVYNKATNLNIFGRN